MTNISKFLNNDRTENLKQPPEHKGRNKPGLVRQFSITSQSAQLLVVMDMIFYVR